MERAGSLTSSAVAIADQPYLHILLEVDWVPLAAQGAGLGGDGEEGERDAPAAQTPAPRAT